MHNPPVKTCAANFSLPCTSPRYSYETGNEGTYYVNQHSHYKLEQQHIKCIPGHNVVSEHNTATS